MKWRPERGWWSLITRLGLILGAGAVLIFSINQTTGVQVSGLQPKETQVVPEPTEKQRDFVDLIKRVERGEAPTGPQVPRRSTVPAGPQPASPTEILPLPPSVPTQPPTQPEPSPSAQPEPSPSAQPEPSPSAQPEPSPSAQPEPSPSAQPDPTPSVQPEPTPSAQEEGDSP
jgi:hypothetical protein